jgi:hypothetical protein
VLGAYRRALATAVVLLVAACGSDHSATQPKTTAAAVFFSFPSPAILIGAVEQATAKVVDGNGVLIPNAPITWTSSVTSVATVTDSGIVQGLAPGVTVITGTSGVAMDTATITVDSAGKVAIDSIRPAQMVQGQAAAIFGHNFSRFTTGNIVVVGVDSITPTSADTNRLNIIVPTVGCLPAQNQQFFVVARGTAAGDTADVVPAIAPVALQVGQVAVLSGPAALSCIQFAAANASVEYLAVIANVTSSLDANASVLLGTQIGSTGPLGFGGFGRVPTVVLKATRSGLVQAPIKARTKAKASAHAATRAPARARAPVHVGRPGAVLPRGRRPTLRSPRFEAWLRGYERRRLSPIGARAALPRSHARSVPAVGDMLQLNVPVAGCENFKTTTGVVQAVGTHGIVVQDAATPAGGFQASDFQSISTEFDSFIYPSDTVHFGGPSDLDSNSRVILYYTPAINKLTETNIAGAGFVPGFFFAGDLFPRASSNAATSCPESNLAEIIYLAVPDPTGQFGPVFPIDTIRQVTRGTVAHELEHLINASNRIFMSGGAFEDTWLDEALAHSAEDFVGRAEYGFTDLQSLTFALISADTGKYAAFFMPNASRFFDWLNAPAVYGAADSRADTSLSVRGAAWSLLRYTEDQHSGGTPATLTRALALGPATGFANLQQATGVPFDSLVVGWLIANFTSGNDSVTVASRDTYLSYDMHSVQAGLTGTTSYPLLITAVGATTAVDSTTVQGNGGAYFDYAIPAVGTSGPSFSIEMANGDQTAVSFPGARLYLLRIK